MAFRDGRTFTIFKIIKDENDVQNDKNYIQNDEINVRKE